MTDQEIDALAREIATKAVADVQSMAPNHSKVITLPTGESCLEFSGIGAYGGIQSLYNPVPAIRRLIRESERVFDDFVVTLTDKQTGEVSKRPLNQYVPEHRTGSIRFMAECSALFLLGSYIPGLKEMVVEVFAESKLFAHGVLGEFVADFLKSDEYEHGVTEMTSDIEVAVKRVADKKREWLRGRFKALPHIVAQRTRGGAYNVKHDWTPQELDCLVTNYSQLQPIWREAKQIARAAQKSSVVSRRNNWREEVLRAYPDLPHDLLNRYQHLRADDAKPSDIALIHAKIKCGVTETYTPRELSDKIRIWNLKKQS